MAGVSVIGANSLAMGPIAPGIAQEFSQPVVLVMMAAAAYGLGTAVSALLLARYIDRFGAKRSLQVALIGLTLGLGLSAVASNAGVLIASQAIAGLAAGVGLPSIYAASALLSPDDKKNTVLGWVLVGWTISLVAGVSLAALVADIFSFRLVYVVLAALAAAVAILSVRLPTDRIRDAQSTHTLRSVFLVFALPLVAPYLIVCFAYMMAFYGVYGYLGDHLVSTLNQPLRNTAWIALSYGLGFGLAVFGDPTIDRFGAKKLIAPAFGLIALVYLALAVSSGSVRFLVSFSFLWGVCNHFGLNVIISGLSSIDENQRGKILGLYSCVTYLAAFAGTLLYGAIYQPFGFALVAITASVTMLASTLFTFRRISRTAR